MRSRVRSRGAARVDEESMAVRKRIESVLIRCVFIEGAPVPYDRIVGGGFSTWAVWVGREYGRSEGGLG